MEDTHCDGGVSTCDSVQERIKIFANILSIITTFHLWLFTIPFGTEAIRELPLNKT
jgi:hypothetical protein